MLKTIQKYFMELLDYIAPQRMDALIVKNINAGDILELPKARDVDGLPWIHSLFQYRNNTVRAMIWELKYKENTTALDTIGGLLYDEIIALASDIVLFDSDATFLLIPIPISTLTRMSRGYNQSEYIAKSILPHDSEHALLYAPQWFEKMKETHTQNKSTSREERIKNLVGCFSADGKVSGHYIFLIDDVVTTGSTLSEARKTLLDAGARNVYAFTIAH